MTSIGHFIHQTTLNPSGGGTDISEQPFNYIAFSQQLYGEKSDKNSLSVKTLDAPKQRTVSYV